MLTSNMKKSHWFYLLLILLFSIFGMKALLHPGLFTAHDIWHQVARIYHYQKALSEGQIPPYWINSMANGYGYPLFFFSYNLPWISGFPLLKLGLDIATTLKILFFISFLLSGVTMYLFISSVFKNKIAGLVSAILYLWAPFHFLSIFVSASIGVVFSFIFPPILFLGADIIKREDSTNPGIILVSIGFAGMALSHAQTLFATLPAFVIFSLYGLNKVFFKRILLSLALGILLCSFYLIPALFYNHNTQSQTQTGFSALYEHNFLNFNQLVYSKWGYGPIVNNAKDGEISFQIGIAQWLSILGVFILLVLKKYNQETKKIAILLILAFALSIAMMMDFSTPLWKFLTKFISLDYPTRFMLPATFIASAMGGIFLSNIKNKRWQVVSLVILIAVALYTNRNHVRVNLYTDIPISLYVASEITTNSYNEYLPLGADPALLNKPHIVVDPTELSVSNFEQNERMMSFVLDTPKLMRVSVGQFSFPGQTVYLDGKITQFTADERGRVNLEVPKGSHKILVRFENTPIINISILLTAIGIIMSLLLLGKKIALKNIQPPKMKEKNVKKSF